jgi:hypothetical protein
VGKRIGGFSDSFSTLVSPAGRTPSPSARPRSCTTSAREGLGRLFPRPGVREDAQVRDQLSCGRHLRAKRQTDPCLVNGIRDLIRRRTRLQHQKRQSPRWPRRKGNTVRADPQANAAPTPEAAVASVAAPEGQHCARKRSVHEGSTTNKATARLPVGSSCSPATRVLRQAPSPPSNEAASARSTVPSPPGESRFRVAFRRPALFSAVQPVSIKGPPAGLCRKRGLLSRHRRPATWLPSGARRDARALLTSTSL